MKILVTGAYGQLGSALHEVLEQRMPGITLYTDRDTLDMTDEKALRNFVIDNDISHIVNCAAYTAVDRAEEDKALCTTLNVTAVENLAKAAEANNAKIIHISTDYVFDGTNHRPYRESDKPNPVSHYGSTKRKGETALLALAPESIIIRTAWLYSNTGHNFVKTILNKGKEGKPLRVVCDQIGAPTFAIDLAEAIASILASPQWVEGIFHFTNEGAISWYDFAKAILRIAKLDTPVTPILSDEYPTAARRPFYSVLDRSRIKATYSLTIPYWEESLAKMIDKENNPKQ